jgi:methanogenic corrinoid protein MtbC1
MLGVPVPTIRSWERRYSIPAPERTSGKHRRYGLDAVSELRELRDEIAAGRHARDAATVVKRRSKERRPGRDHAGAILGAAMQFDAAGIRNHLDGALAELGLEPTLQAIVLPVLREIGSRWEAGRCDVANEHLASQEIRAWLNHQVSFARFSADRGVLVLACGPKDAHSLGLESFYVLLARRGWNCRVLGAETPSESLVKAARATPARGVIVTSHLNSNRRSAVESIRSVAKLPGVAVFYAGNAFVSDKSREGVPGTYLEDHLGNAADLVESALRS